MFFFGSVGSIPTTFTPRSFLISHTVKEINAVNMIYIYMQKAFLIIDTES